MGWQRRLARRCRHRRHRICDSVAELHRAPHSSRQLCSALERTRHRHGRHARPAPLSQATFGRVPWQCGSRIHDHSCDTDRRSTRSQRSERCRSIPGCSSRAGAAGNEAAVPGAARRTRDKKRKKMWFRARSPQLWREARRTRDKRRKCEHHRNRQEVQRQREFEEIMRDM